MYIARRRQSILLAELNEILGRLKPAMLRIDTRGTDLLAEVTELEASGGLHLVGGALVGWKCEMGEMLSECGVWQGHVLDAFKRSNWLPKLSDRTNAD